MEKEREREAFELSHHHSPQSKISRQQEMEKAIYTRSLFMGSIHNILNHLGPRLLSENYFPPTTSIKCFTNASH